MKKIVFIIHTEYHLIEAISYIINCYPSTQFETYVYRLSNGRGRLDKFDLNIDVIPAKFETFIYNYGYKPSLEMKFFLDKVLNIDPDVAVIFDDGNYWTSYFLRKLKKKGCRICLAPDGANVYFPNNLSKKEIVRRFFDSAFFRYTHFLLPPFIPLIHHNFYAYNKYIDEIWAEYPDFIDNRKGRLCRLKKVLNTPSIVEAINQVFNFKGIPNGMKSDKIIIFFDAPFGECVAKKTVEILKVLKNKHPEYPVYIKIHPSSPLKVKEIYNQIEGVDYLPMDYPAELYIQNLTNSVLISVVSNVMFCYNSLCRYYWIYPMIEGLDLNKNHSNPTTYIKEVEDINDICF